MNLDTTQIKELAMYNYTESLHFHMSHTIKGCTDYIKEKNRLPNEIKSININIIYGEEVKGSQIHNIKDGIFYIYLNDNMKNTYKNGKYDKELVEKVRDFVLHELGHAVLHIDMLIGAKRNQAGFEKDHENEAAYFSKHMKCKRKEIIKNYYSNGIIEIL